MIALLRSPRQGLIAQRIILLLLSGIALILRIQLDMEGVRDVDALNFGLAAWDFNPIEQRPHPPGYLGYAIYLKGLHLLLPGLGPASLAKWGCRILGVLCVPAAWWTCRVLLAPPGATPKTALPALRPLTAAALVVAQPLLWYYGADGQSHSSEALATLLLFGCAVGCRRSGRTRDLLLLALAFGLAGSLRPTISLLCSPLLLWVAWGHPLRTWVFTVVSGLLGTLAWYVPTVWASGGLDLYTRAGDALIQSIFLRNFSVFSTSADLTFVFVNTNIVVWGLILSLILFAGWMGSDSESDVSWRRAASVVVAVSAAFYTLVYAAESGYFTGLAALSVLAPATWPDSARRARRGIGLTVAGALLGASFVLFGPAETGILGAGSAARIVQPTFRSLWRWEAFTASHRAGACNSNETGHTVLITDSNRSELTRGVALDCGLSVVRWLVPTELQPKADGLLVYRGMHIDAVPTGVPFERGSPATYRFKETVRRVRISPTASDRVARALSEQQRCPRQSGQVREGLPRASSSPTWDVACLPALTLGSHRIVFAQPDAAAPEPPAPRSTPSPP